MDLSKQQITQLNRYYDNNAVKLHKTVDKILRKFGGVTDKQEFYSLANEVFLDVLQRYDPEKKFDPFLYSCLSNRIKSKMTSMNCKKRKKVLVIDKEGEEEKIYIGDVSLDAPIGDDGEENLTLKDVIPSSYILEENILEMKRDDKVETYLKKLSIKQREIVMALIDGEKPGQIQKCLGLTEREYADQLIGIRSFRNIKVLF